MNLTYSHTIWNCSGLLLICIFQDFSIYWCYRKFKKAVKAYLLYVTHNFHKPNNKCYNILHVHKLLLWEDDRICGMKSLPKYYPQDGWEFCCELRNLINHVLRTFTWIGGDLYWGPPLHRYCLNIFCF